MEDVLLIYFEQIVSFCENSSLNSTNFTESVIFALILEKFTQHHKKVKGLHHTPKKQSRSPQVEVVGNEMPLSALAAISTRST